MRNSFSYPLAPEALAEFCHPAPGSGLAAARRIGPEIVAANGYVAIRCHRGAWLDREFEEADSAFAERIGKLAWERWETLSDDWRMLDEVGGLLFRRGMIRIWGPKGLGASPAVMVGGVMAVRLSLLQLVAMLPRCEVHCGVGAAHLWFRFSGGRGVIAQDARFAAVAPAFSIFEPRRDVFSGERLERQKTPPPRLVQPGVNWPPVDMTDF